MWARVVAASLLLFTVLAVGTAGAHRVDRRTTASWYEGSYGACGKPLRGRYAASRWFGCGDRVRVFLGRKTAVVTILDRCQCGVDLRKSVARRLGISGVARVRVAKVHPGYRREHPWIRRWFARHG